MSNRHIFGSPDGLVTKCIKGIIAYNPALSLDEENRVVINTEYDKSKVSLVSGGGSGHEPAVRNSKFFHQKSINAHTRTNADQFNYSGLDM